MKRLKTQYEAVKTAGGKLFHKKVCCETPSLNNMGDMEAELNPCHVD